MPHEGAVTYGDVVKNNAELAKLRAAGIRGIGPWKNTLVAFTENNYVNKSTIAGGIATVKQWHKLGFQVHIYTLRNEAKRPDGSGYLAWDYEADSVNEYDMFFKRVGVDGGFSDQVGSLARYLGRK